MLLQFLSFETLTSSPASDKIGSLFMMIKFVGVTCSCCSSCFFDADHLISSSTSFNL